MVDIPLFMFCVKQTTAYEMRISDWSSDVCSSDLHIPCQSNFELVEGFFVCRDLAGQKVLHCFQTKSGKTTEKADVAKAEKLRTRLGMSPADSMHVWYIILPCDALV